MSAHFGAAVPRSKVAVPSGKVMRRVPTEARTDCIARKGIFRRKAPRKRRKSDSRRSLPGEDWRLKRAVQRDSRPMAAGTIVQGFRGNEKPRRDPVKTVPLQRPHQGAEFCVQCADAQGRMRRAGAGVAAPV